jgi:hypothetical protein
MHISLKAFRDFCPEHVASLQCCASETRLDAKKREGVLNVVVEDFLRPQERQSFFMIDTDRYESIQPFVEA